MIEFTPKISDFEEQPGLNKELQVTGIYGLFKVVKKTVSGTGDVDIICGFPPKLVLVSCQNSTECSDGSSDFTTTYCIRKFTGVGFATSESTNLINLSGIVATIGKRLYNGFQINISSISGSQNIYFTCYS